MTTTTPAPKDNSSAQNMVKVNSSDGSGLMFDQIAKRYDLLNRIISLGLDQSWRRKLVASLPKQGEILDVATGTADVALSIARTYPQANVIGLDPSVNMLNVGRDKIKHHKLLERVQLMEGDALEMPYEDRRFMGSCVAFGVRNFSDRLQGMKEMNRVTTSGGPVCVLELSEPRDGILSPFVRLHVHHIVPWMGALLSGNSEYRYLQKSVEAFPAPEVFKQLMEEAGMSEVKIQRMPFGVAHLYTGRAG